MYGIHFTACDCGRWHLLPTEADRLVFVNKQQIPRERVIVSAASDRVVVLNSRKAWISDLETGEELYSVDNKSVSSPGNAAISHSANRLAIGNDVDQIRMLKLDDGSLVWSKAIGRLQVTDVRFFPKARQLAVCTGIIYEPEDVGGGIHIYDVQTGEIQKSIETLPHSPMGVVVSPDEKFLCAFLNYGGEISIWNLPDLVQVRCFGISAHTRGSVKDDGVSNLDISSDSQFIAAGGDNNFGIWRLSTGERIVVGRTEKNEKVSVKFHPSNQTLYVAMPDQIQIWEQIEDHFMLKSTTKVHLEELHHRRYFFIADKPWLGVIDYGGPNLTVCRLPE